MLHKTVGFRRIAGIFGFIYTFLQFPQPVEAQGTPLTTTAAWSSQIVAFWGAIYLGVRSIIRTSAVLNAGASLLAFFSVYRRTFVIRRALLNDDWILFSGWKNGPTRLDTVIICWTTEDELSRLTFQVAAKYECYSHEWQLLVCGRRVAESTMKMAIWIQSPTQYAFCAAKVKEDGSAYFPVKMADLHTVLDHLRQGSSVDDSAKALVDARETRASRVAYYSEVPSEMIDVTTPARHFTRIQARGQPDTVPFATININTGLYGSHRALMMNSATTMYSLLHLTVSVAVALMAAATGRGLAVWWMAVRPALNTLGVGGLEVEDPLISLWAFDGANLRLETLPRSTGIAGDMLGFGLPISKSTIWVLIPLFEMVIISAGWIYGTIHITRLNPAGVVGHGMLWLSFVTSLALCMRCAVGIWRGRKRVMIGRFANFEASFARHPVGERELLVPVEPFIQHSKPDIPMEVHLAALFLRQVHDDDTGLVAAASIIRLPSFNASLTQYAAKHILQYQYNGDAIRSIRGKEFHTAQAFSVWRAMACVSVTAGCSCLTVVYAYISVTSWVKFTVEVVLALNVTFFSILDRTEGLNHTRDVYITFMVSSLVTSGMWYVGVKDVG